MECLKLSSKFHFKWNYTKYITNKNEKRDENISTATLWLGPPISKPNHSTNSSLSHNQRIDVQIEFGEVKIVWKLIFRSFQHINISGGIALGMKNQGYEQILYTSHYWMAYRME